MENTMRARIGGGLGPVVAFRPELRFGKISESLRGELEAVVIRGKSPERFWGSRIAQAAHASLGPGRLCSGV
jgi:hypothetical protein